MIWVIDFGSQYTQLIIRKSRELGRDANLMTFEECSEKLKENKEKPQAIILSGGPSSVYTDQNDYSRIFNENIPVLGVCYGMQIIAHYFKGQVEKGSQGEYGKSVVSCLKSESDLPQLSDVWMSHFDEVTNVPSDFEITYKSENGLIAGMICESKKIMAVQFHPEVHHTTNGIDLLNYFFNKLSKADQDWSNESMIKKCSSEFDQVKTDEAVLCGFSGGVDSLVAAQLAYQEIGKKLFCIFIDHGLTRPQDRFQIETLQQNLPFPIKVVDSSKVFLEKLNGLSDPEKKRKVIGVTFIEEFEREVKHLEKENSVKFNYLLQGTLYPDVIESISPHKKDGKSVTIKSHHNVGGLPERMNLKIIEPLKFLFKDEVRIMGQELGLKSEWVNRHPFPGPGLGVRILGEVTPHAVRACKESDQILFEELKNWSLYGETWQAFTVFLPVQTVGVKGDERAYENVICLRMVNSVDGMTATWSRMPFDFLDKVSSRITNEVKGITRVVYDITSKPPGTIEWE